MQAEDDVSGFYGWNVNSVVLHRTFYILLQGILLGREKFCPKR
jgi:hypothetical protein